MSGQQLFPNTNFNKKVRAMQAARRTSKINSMTGPMMKEPPQMAMSPRRQAASKAFKGFGNTTGKGGKRKTRTRRNRRTKRNRRNRRTRRRR